MSKMEWCSDIQNQQTFLGFVEHVKNDPEPSYAYVHAARLFLEGSIAGRPDRCVMVVLHVPTSAAYADGSTQSPRLNAYEVSGVGVYDTSDEIFSMRNAEEITYENAELQMLALAKDLCD